MSYNVNLNLNYNNSFLLDNLSPMPSGFDGRQYLYPSPVDELYIDEQLKESSSLQVQPNSQDNSQIENNNNSSNETRKSERKRKIISPPSDGSNLSKNERNCKAAKDYRKRKKVYVQELEARLATAQKQIKQLNANLAAAQGKIDKLTNQVILLKGSQTN